MEEGGDVWEGMAAGWWRKPPQLEKQLLRRGECSRHRSITLYSPSGTGVDEYAIKDAAENNKLKFLCHRLPHGTHRETNYDLAVLARS